MSGILGRQCDAFLTGDRRESADESRRTEREAAVKPSVARHRTGDAWWRHHFTMHVWWQQLSPAWQRDLRKAAAITGEPDTAALQRISELRRLSCAGAGITSLEPLCTLPMLEHLNASRNPLADVRLLASLPRLRKVALNLSAV